MEQKTKNYERPHLHIIEVEVEQGIAVTPTGYGSPGAAGSAINENGTIYDL